MKQKREAGQMTDREPIQSVDIVIDEELPEVGDSKKKAGGFDLEINSGYDMLFYPGTEISWSLEATRIFGGIEVEGFIRGGLSLECYRCLESYRFQVDGHIREHVICLDSHEDKEREADRGEYHIEGGVFDLLQVIRDAVGLSLPIKRLCTLDCRGLCGVCGRNLNTGSCECLTVEVDARLKPLEALREKLENAKLEDER
ncbi:MAG: DUF177 domain-containing protein [Actinobacteria bacterium]|nr:DUF177 domain-containing protein [Actinomycetota bacterium]